MIWKKLLLDWARFPNSNINRMNVFRIGKLFHRLSSFQRLERILFLLNFNKVLASLTVIKTQLKRHFWWRAIIWRIPFKALDSAREISWAVRVCTARKWLQWYFRVKFRNKKSCACHSWKREQWENWKKCQNFRGSSWRTLVINILWLLPFDWQFWVLLFCKNILRLLSITSFSDIRSYHWNFHSHNHQEIVN